MEKEIVIYPKYNFKDFVLPKTFFSNEKLEKFKHLIKELNF